MIKLAIQVFVIILYLLFCNTTKAQVSISGIINSYTPVTNILTPACGQCDFTCKDEITIIDPSSFSPGDKALIIQMKGADIDLTNTAAGGAITAINNAGNYEFFEIESISANILIPKYNLIKTYDAAGLVQVVRIPDYGANEVTIVAPVVALDWDPATGVGGVVAMRAEKIIFNDNIDVIGAGYKGVQMTVNGTPDNCSLDPSNQYILPSTDLSSYTKGNGIVIDDPNTNRGRAPRANGGGSGVSGDSGGGGGSNFGAGGDGGWRWCDEFGPQDGLSPEIAAGGVGGVALSSYLALDKVFFGGAGGPGWVSTSNPSSAADGGGIVIIFADTIVGNGNSILADGTSPVAVNPVGAPDGGGGGGGGGSIVLKTNTFVGTINVSMNGGKGQDLNTSNYHGPGAGGGGGVLLYSLGVLPANVNLLLNGGAKGIHSDSYPNGAEDGAPGGSISLYVPIQNPNYETNLDNDVTLSSCDIDDDNDGIPDIVEAYNLDHDNDGIPDYQDAQFCLATFEGINGWNCATDGLPDPSGDMDADGRVNYKDSDFPYCGVLAPGSAVCSNFDNDGDGHPNHADLDADDDGIPDIIEAGATDIDADGQVDDINDTDNDGLVDIYDNDDTDGPNGTSPCPNQPGCLASTSTSLAPVPDNDNDFLYDFLDRDSDNDGIPDVVEAGGVDVNGDGRADGYLDSDKDGYNDIYDGRVCETTKGPDIHAAAQVNNGVNNPNNALGPPGITFASVQKNDDIELDLGQVVPAGTILEITIARLGTNTNNTVQNISEAISTGGPYSNLKVYTSSFNTVTGPEIFSYQLAADAQFILVERQTRGAALYGLTYSFDIITCNNGTPIYVTGPDANLDGLPDSYPANDHDADGILDHHDLDVDNDGIPDVVEAGGTDVNGDGRADNFADADKDGFNDLVDGDPANLLTTDDDSPGTNSANALQLTGPDTNNDGAPDTYVNGDADNDGILNHLDLDSDNDGIPDVIESGGTNVNGNGLADNYADLDNDGFNDIVDGDPANALAAGSDGPGSNSADAQQITGADSNADGAPDSYPIGDTDGDMKLDQLDLDADNDGIPDIVEVGGADIDNNGMADSLAETDNDGFSSLYDTDLDNNGTVDAGPQSMIVTTSDGNGDGAPDNGINGADFDGDGITSHLDLDADNDGILDVVEARFLASDTDRDGMLDDALTNDPDNNGWSNTADGSNGGISPVQTSDTDLNGFPEIYPTGDFESDNHPDFIDIDADNDGIADNTEGQATENYIAPSSIDTDRDGIDDNYDNNDALFGGAGSGILPFNKDKIDNADFLDNDTDNDGIPDLTEGHDTDGDGIPDAGSVANTGFPGVVDIDNDGLLDGYDNNTGSPDPSNNGLQGASYPDVFNKRTPERDWREANKTYATDDVNTTPSNVTVNGNVLTNDHDYELNNQVVTGNITIDTDGDGIPETNVALGGANVVGGVNENGSPNPNAGILTQNSDGGYIFIPDPSFIGEVTYSYQICDDGQPQACDDAIVTIDVEPMPSSDNGELAPAPDVNVTYDGIAVNGQVLANDNDPDGDNLVVSGTISIDTDGDGTVDASAVLGVANIIAGVDATGTPFLNAGTITQNTNGNYTFDPVAGFIGVVNYIYTACDDGVPVTCKNTTVTIDVLPSVYNSTNAIDDEEFIDQGIVLNENVLTNDNDIEGDNQIGGVTLVTGPTQGVLLLNSDGTYTYTPSDPNFSGNDHFVYSVCDNNLLTQCDTATVYITLLPVKRDFGDAPAGCGIAVHRAIRDLNLDNVLDGATDIWLGSNTDFETVSQPVNGDNFDDAITLGNSPGEFPRTVTASTLYNVDLTVNSAAPDLVFYGMWIDWNNDNIYEDFYSGSVITASPTLTTVGITSPPAVFTNLVNIRIRVDDQALNPGDFTGVKTNGEVEDYQYLMNDFLPVEMLYFNASLKNRNIAVLDWSTATELNNDRFEIEHALPATAIPEFNNIGFVNGFGTTLNTQYYEYEVPNLISGIHYFRLRQVDIDGSFEYSEVKALQVVGNGSEDLFPTLLNEDNHSIFVKVAEKDNYSIEIITPLGQIVQIHKGVMDNTQYFEIKLDPGKYASGVYFVRVSSDSRYFTKKIRIE